MVQRDECVATEQVAEPAIAKKGGFIFDRDREGQVYFIAIFIILLINVWEKYM